MDYYEEEEDTDFYPEDVVAGVELPEDAGVELPDWMFKRGYRLNDEDKIVNRHGVVLKHFLPKTKTSEEEAPYIAPTAPWANLGRAHVSFRAIMEQKEPPRPPAPVPPARPPLQGPRRTKWCNSAIAGRHCHRGQACGYAHNEAEFDFPTCNFGRNCTRRTCDRKHDSESLDDYKKRVGFVLPPKIRAR